MNDLKISVINPTNGIPSNIRDAWISLQKSNSKLRSPFFSFEFYEIIASVKSNVEFTIIYESDKVVGIFPYERGVLGFAGPVGSFLSDYHGVISQLNFSIDPIFLLKQCQLNSWDFQHLPNSQLSFYNFSKIHRRSPIIDLSAGYNEYVREKNNDGTEQIKKSANLFRRMEREIGPVRFVFHSLENSVLDKLIEWKTVQFRKKKWRDIFSIRWVRQAVEKIYNTQTAEFSGVLSALYAGDNLVAIHFGMRSASVLHYWFPAYAPSYSKYSPGVILLLKMAEAAPGMGITMIDLGCGEHSYKNRLMNGFQSTAQGRVQLSSAVCNARDGVEKVVKLAVVSRSIVGRSSLGITIRKFFHF